MKRRTRQRVSRNWARLSDSALLDVRLCDLNLRIEGTELERYLDRLYWELERRGLQFRPHAWLAEEWFTPDGVPGIGIPFYLAHPRLKKLERKQMLAVEGGTEKWCMRILRHEAGHAIDNAYRLHYKSKYREIFGKYTEPYPEYYQPRPYSRSYVLHLDMWYAQSHPAEDFAETFAVWLNPGSRWRSRYQGWPALRKLEYVDGLMTQLAGKTPPVRTTRRVEPLKEVRITLREHYQAKRMHYGEEWPDFYDRDLRRLFSDDPKYRANKPAWQFLDQHRALLRRIVSRWTGAYQYTIDQVLLDMIDRCRELKLRLALPERKARSEALMLLTVQTMNYLHEGHHRVIV